MNQTVSRVPDHDHPGHASTDMPDQPARLPSRGQQFVRERNCRRAGGHWWHPADPMIAWFCCQCGRGRDGMPKDGT